VYGSVAKGVAAVSVKMRTCKLAHMSDEPSRPCGEGEEGTSGFVFSNLFFLLSNRTIHNFTIAPSMDI
jgi:hypothetical protein